MKRDFEKLREKYLSKRATKYQFQRWHNVMYQNSRLADNRDIKLKGLELGCGVTPMSDIYSDIISTDIEKSPLAEKIVDATNIPYEDQSFDSIFGVNVFHHISDKKKFLQEAKRVLTNKGTIVLLEPSYSLFSKAIYPYLFSTEYYDTTESIHNLNTYDPMEDANQAASYILFVKNKDIFLKDSGFILQNIDYCKNSFSFLLSGGLNFMQLAPFFIIKKLMNASRPYKIFSLHWIIVLRKVID